MLHPHQFRVNEAWIAFQLNDDPVQTERDGSFDIVCLMDAASCFILGSAFIPFGESDPSELETRRLFKASWAHKRQFPKMLFVPKGWFQTTLRAAAERRGISVVSVEESQLLVFIGEARQGFKEYSKGRSR
ncbi:MAG: hypothetical protein GX443_18780 [Deltaproteobacteria bacterium]|nr:hypothetical protein [Deltaproteobacteria bacterium]